MARLDAAHGPIEYEIEGREDGTPLMLITGLGAQLVRWSPTLRQALIARGFRVIRLDNRDAGLSRHYHDAGRPDLKQVAAALRENRGPGLAYTLGDMADDVATLMDALGIASAHVAGSSMGGFIAQLVAIRHPERVRSLTLIMTSTGNPELPGPPPEVQAMLAARAEPGVSPADQAVANARLIASPAFPFDEARVRARIAEEAERGSNGDSYLRQRAAILAGGDRREDLRKLDVPTMVLHGDADLLVRVEAGRDVAANIPGAELRVFEGMGHEIPEGLVDQVADAIAEVAAKAKQPA